MMMAHEDDPKQKLLTELGDLSGIELFHNQVLLATYIRPQKTKSGLYLTDKHTDEDRFQSKVGLLVRQGPLAFQEDGSWFSGLSFKEGDWLVFRPSDGWSITVNGVLCRIFDDIHIRGRVPHPDAVW
jgi:co-chaperonin GroES (HSP10)